ncbi:P-loop containing nucleoside triphosphate hydrolase protein [Hymenopellis radicata]|nr:P-loop containing nucleoside triphosphate hydrolase protein [Hymenopellis radicata]
MDVLNGLGHLSRTDRVRHSEKVSRDGPPLNGTLNGKHQTTSVPSEIWEQRQNLPIAKGKDAIVEEIRRNDVTVLIGETGSGKTTQIPQYLLESGLAGSGTIAVTQPRRVAATSLATRVATEQGTSLGKLVGYSVRFDERTSAATRIKYMTDGMIARELLSDPLLSKYSVVIVDEAHERTVTTDILLSNLKTILAKRNASPEVNGKGKGKDSSNPLKVVVMSATLDAEKFSGFFLGAKILYVKGRQHPVKIYHSAKEQIDYLDGALTTFFQIHTDQPSGDVLIFLPGKHSQFHPIQSHFAAGQDDIESLQKSIQGLARRLPPDGMNVLVCTMYAAQASGQNSQVFISAPANTRKCILATNIAETSITIPGVKYVIDTGKCKEKWYFASTSGGMNTLVTRDISQSSALQRAGRAGREGTGYCYRLYTEESFQKMATSAQPEILRCSLASSFLELKCIDQNLESMDLMDKPDTETLVSAGKTLYMLGALSMEKELTPIGRSMTAFPLEPIYARAIVESKEHGCTSEIISIVSILSCTSKLFLDNSEQRDAIADVRRKFRHHSGDHLTALNVLRAYEDLASETKNKRRQWCRDHFLNERSLSEAKDIADQLKQVCKRNGMDPNTSSGDNEDAILQSLGCGLCQNVAFLQPDGSYKQVIGASIVKIHPSSTMFEKKVEAIIYDELIYTNHTYARGVSSISKSMFASCNVFNVRRA